MFKDREPAAIIGKLRLKEQNRLQTVNPILFVIFENSPVAMIREFRVPVQQPIPVQHVKILPSLTVLFKFRAFR